MIRLENINFSYTDHPVLSDITLEFEKGKLYAVIGPNGCGKTTLLNVIARLITPNNGGLSIDSKAYREHKRKDFAKKLAYMPQHPTGTDMTVADYVTYGRFPHLGISRKLSQVDKHAVTAALKKTDTYRFSERCVNELSGGERQRVHIAMLLAQDTPYILLDEPTAYLDIANRFSVFRLLQAIKDEGKCVIAVLHELDSALKYSDEIIVLNDGKAIIKGSTDDIMNSGYIESVFGVACKAVDIDSKKEYLILPRE